MEVIAGSFDPALPTGGSRVIPVDASLPHGVPDGCQGATFTLDIAFILGEPGSSFADEVRSVSNVFVADTLPAPESMTASPNATGTEIDLDWVPGPGDFATSWEIARESGAACSGWTPSTANLAAGLTGTDYTDTAVDQGETYCYAVRGAFENWRSVYTVAAHATTPEPIRLYFHDTTGDNDPGSKQLVEENPAGFQRFGCRVLAVVVCLTQEPTQYTMRSTDAYQVHTNTGWRAHVGYTASSLVSLLSDQTLSVAAWYVPAGAACGDVPGGTTGMLIASASFAGTSLLNLFSESSGTAEIPLDASGGFENPEVPVVVCVRMSVTGFSLLELASHLTIHNGPDSWIEGAYE